MHLNQPNVDILWDALGTSRFGEVDKVDHQTMLSPEMDDKQSRRGYSFSRVWAPCRSSIQERGNRIRSPIS